MVSVAFCSVLPRKDTFKYLAWFGAKIPRKITTFCKLGRRQNQCVLHVEKSPSTSDRGGKCLKTPVWQD